MVRLMEHNHGKSMESYLSRFPIKYFDEDDDYTWKLIGSSRKNVPLYEARDINGSVIEDGMAGVNGEPFYLVYQEDAFADGEVIVGEKNEVYPLRILEDPRQEGTLTIYKVELMGGVLSGMPAEELLFGKRFSVDFAPVEKEMSRKVGDARFAAPLTMRNEFSRVRIQHKAPGSSINKKVAVGIPLVDASGKTQVHSFWMHHVDYQIEKQFSQYKNYAIVYGTSNRTGQGEYRNIGKSGNILQTGAGIRELMSYANHYFYNEFSLKLLEDALFELNTGKTDFSERTVILETGERGATLFHKAVLNEVSGWQAFNFLGGNGNINTVQKSNSPMHDNALTAGFQFVEYKAPMGITIKVNVNPMYDDPYRNKIAHPLGGLAESYRFDIYDLGNPNEPNIQIAKIKGMEDIRGFQRGLRNPWTGEMGGDMAYDEDSTVLHKFSVFGAICLDPNRTMSLVPAILAS